MRPEPQTMSVRQVALALGISLKRVYDLIWEKRLPATKKDGKWTVASDVIQQRIRESGHGNK